MKLKMIVNTLAVVMSMTAFSLAHATDVPDSYQKAMKLYKEENSQAMLKALFAGSPISDQKAIDNINTELQKAEGVCGKYVDYELIKKVDLTDSSMILYTQINFQKCPMFVYEIYYKIGDNWVVTQINFDTNPVNIFPTALMSGE